MNDDQKSKINQLRIDPGAKRRSTGTMKLIFVVVAIAAVAAVLVWRPWADEGERFSAGKGKTVTASETKSAATSGAKVAPASGTNAPTVAQTPSSVSNSLLTVSGYIINRERIELSPRFMGVVRWIGVRKGDSVTNGQVVVLLDDSEYQARKRELKGRIELAQVGIRRAEIELKRTAALVESRVETQRTLDLAELDLQSAQAQVHALEGELQTIETYLDWCVIRAPITGVVLEKLVDANELVTPQSFGGSRGPSTAVISLGDPQDLQVEIDMNEADLGKVHLGQRCKVSPEAYLERSYEGVVVEIAPEASRQKGTLQIKVQIKAPDKYLTPELSAKVDFLNQ
jgi:HlyD family secretion protein